MRRKFVVGFPAHIRQIKFLFISSPLLSLQKRMHHSYNLQVLYENIYISKNDKFSFLVTEKDIESSGFAELSEKCNADGALKYLQQLNDAAR
jgi:hypothetical protein